ncbi:MAG TPA: sialidase family protein [Polyangiaceae bacterium]|nr:sialidase family protein [Polyangiaceae bacterium]
MLLLGLLWMVGSSALPRLRAAWQLPTAATALADYALCMVGPTGPSLLRDDPTEFWSLVRRRLVSAGPDDHPFAKCAKAAVELTGSTTIGRAHEAPAVGFTEYGSDDASGGSAFHLGDLTVSTRKLAELADAAWPFARGGYTNLVKASAFAPEAAHPIEPPRPAIGRAPLPPRSLSTCRSVGAPGEFALGVSADRRFKVVRTVTPDGVVTESAFAPAEARVFAVGCDASRAVIAFGRAGSRKVALALCAYRGDCSALKLPRAGAEGDAVRFPLDVARVDGTTVIATNAHGIVRVASSRDDGKSWTPFVVAFDAVAHRDVTFDVSPPDRLFSLGRRLALGATGSRPSSTYPLLVSDDAGASWHAP